MSDQNLTTSPLLSPHCDRCTCPFPSFSLSPRLRLCPVSCSFTRFQLLLLVRLHVLSSSDSRTPTRKSVVEEGWPLPSSTRKRWLDRKSAAQWVGLAAPTAPVKLHSGTDGGHVPCRVCRKGQWARLRQQSLQPSVVDLGSRGAAAPGSRHAGCLQIHTSRWFVHGESFSGCQALCSTGWWS